MFCTTGSRVLIIEKQMIIAADICEQLRSLGHEVIGLISHMDKAMHFIQGTPPDIVMMNIGQKEKESRLSLAELLMNIYRIPVIFLSADIDRETCQRLIDIRAYAFISKPFDTQDLQQGIDTVRRRMAMEAMQN